MTLIIARTWGEQHEFDVARAVDQLVAFGPEGAALLERLREKIEDLSEELPGDPLHRRDAAVVAYAAAFFVGTTNRIAGEMAADLASYEGRAWRQDKRLRRSPHQPNTPADFRFRILRDSVSVRGRRGENGAIGKHRIRQILSLANERPISISNSGQDTFVSFMETRSSKMNAALKLPVHQFISRFADSPDGRKIIEQESAAIIKHRREILAALAALAAEAEKEAPTLQKAVDLADKTFRAGQKELEKLADALARANAAKSAANFKYEGARARLEAELRDIPEQDAIAEFRSRMLDELDWTRKQIDIARDENINQLTGERTARSFSNMDSVQTRVAAIRAAMDEADALALSADPSQIASRLEALRAGLPAVKPAVIPAEK